jgi:DNA-directed RNA polymerase beta subunit
VISLPDFKLPLNNVFNFRQSQWDESEIIMSVSEMLKAGEPYDIRLKKIAFSPKKKQVSTEIKKTISKMLAIEIQVGEAKTVNLNYEIPTLINNYFYVGGNRKIPILQLFDKPVISRKNIVKIRTNIQTIQIEKSLSGRSGFYYTTYIFNKKIPLAHLLLSKHGADKLKEDFKLDDESHIVGTNESLLLDDLRRAIEDQTIQPPKVLSKYFRGKTDAEILENIDLLTQIDIFTKNYFHTENIIDELVWAIRLKDSKNPNDQKLLDDCDLSNKRLRFLEYYLYHFLCKDFYNMIVTMKKQKKGSFNNNSKVILTNANTSPIIQYECPINPIDELSRLTRIAMTGPGGFKKDNIPSYLRDIHPSMLGKICPADTGDRENCGTLLYLTPSISLTKDGLFNDGQDKVISSITIGHVPFLEHDDPTRLQMASSQMRHSIMLKEFDLPLVQTGVEGLYTDHTSFIFRAEKSGKVIYKDKDIIVVQYNDKKCRAFNIGYKKSRLSVVDFYNTYYDVGEPFKAGDIIAESNYLNQGKLTIGRNIKTSVMTWYGYNYEDAIVISDKLIKEDRFTSLHYVDLSFEITPDKVLLSLSDDPNVYQPLLKVGQRLKRGDVYAIIKSVCSKGDTNFDVVFDAPTKKIVEEDCTISEVSVFINKLNTDIEQYSQYIKNLVKQQNDKKQDLIDTLRNFLTKDELEQFLVDLEIDETSKEEDKFKVRGETIEGILINITAIYERPIQVGDKLGNRHGNKGIISCIVEESKMPKDEDGESAEMIINPLGIISRMNVGQLFELHLAGALVKLKENVIDKHQTGCKKLVNSKDMTKEDAIKFTGELITDIYDYIMGFIKIIDRTEGNYYSKQLEKQLRKTPIDKFIENIKDFYILQPPFESVKEEDISEALEYVGAKYEYPCYDPISKQATENPVAFGYMYFAKLNHISEDKNAVRGIGPYASKTSQPLHGKVRKGGQRLGEMEVWSLIAHGASENLNEVLTTKSDSVQKRDQYISDMIQNSELLWNEEEDPVSQSLRLLQSSLKSIGLDYEICENEEDDES